MKCTFIKNILFLFIILLFGAGCAPPFPKQTMERVDQTLPYSDIKANPERFTGKWIMAGGIIVDSKSSKDGNFIEVLQKPLGRDGEPKQTDKTEGRFLVSSSSFLDPAVYQRGRIITVIGEVAGKKVLPLGEINYEYPLLKAEALHLWEPSAYTGPSIHFGIGVFHSF